MFEKIVDRPMVIRHKVSEYMRQAEKSTGNLV